MSLIIGSEFLLADGLRVVFLAKNRTGYRNLTRLITRARRAAPKGSYRLLSTDILAAQITGCLGLLPCNPTPNIKTALKHRYRRLEQNATWLQQLLPNQVWISVEQPANGFDHEHLHYLQNISTRTGVPLVAAGNVHMHIRSRQKLQDTLTAIRLGMTIHEIGHRLSTNAERHLRTLSLLEKVYPTKLLCESMTLARHCTFSLDELHYSYPSEFIPGNLTQTDYLHQLTIKGMQNRWPDSPPEKVKQQITYELELIRELGYEAYFLTVYDIVHFARTHNILCQGRGSAANSAVCYCLGITEVDPAHMDLLFERFISRERNEPPDIDVDFEHERREEVMQYVYRKYGRNRAALTAAVITYRPRSAVRDVGKALGINSEQVERMAKNTSWWDEHQVVSEKVRETGLDPKNPAVAQALQIIEELMGFPRHLSQHSGGFVLSHEPLCDLVPIENAAMAERTVIQWDKDDIDALGLLKVDCLALGMLSAIHKSFDLIRKHRNRTLTMATVPAEDQAVYRMISKADTIGVFQIESRAQMAMLPRLRPQCFYDLVIEVAIVRPGPIQGDMVHPYLKRRKEQEAVTYPSEEVRRVLKRTLGVPIFQEQVIQLAMIAAGFTPGEADGLRRSMAAWRRRGGLQHYEEKLVSGMRNRGYDEIFARQIYHQILGFGEYGFPESHAASFALLVYVSAWLKHHEPAAFTCALLNSQPMGFYAPSQLTQDARRHGVEIRPADVTVSNWDCTLEQVDRNHAIRLGLRLVKGFSRNGGERLAAARTQRPLRDIDNLAHRAQLNQADLQALAAAGALKNLVSDHRRQAAWSAAGYHPGMPIFGSGQVAEGTPMLRTPNKGEETYADYVSMGLTLGTHPLALLRSQFIKLRIITSVEVYQCVPGATVQVAGLVVTRQRPSSAKQVTFVTLEDEAGSINLIVWKKVAESQQQTLAGATLLGASGVIQREGEVLHLVAKRLFDYTAMLGNLTTRSRDFR
jgi:error-prone DNA polymerase